jgi:hypothetical protein
VSDITQVNTFEAPGLYEVSSTSPTRYYADSRAPHAPRYMRWRGPGISLSSYMDNQWHDLLRLTAAPDESPYDITEWTLEVGKFHTFYTTREADHSNGPLYWVGSRICEQIRRLETMPEPETRIKEDAWLPRDRMVVLIALAVPVAGGDWVAFVPDFPGLLVRVRSLEEAHIALRNEASALTGRDGADFIVSVHYVPQAGDEE